MPLNIHTLVSMPFAQNTYVVWQPGRQDALVIDPGMEPDLILDFLREQGLRAAAILNTHGHADHIAGNEAMKQAFPQAPLVIGVHEVNLLSDANANLSAPFGMPIVSPPGTKRLDITCEHVTVGLQAMRRFPGVRTATVFGQSITPVTRPLLIRMFWGWKSP